MKRLTALTLAVAWTFAIAAPPIATAAEVNIPLPVVGLALTAATTSPTPATILSDPLLAAPSSTTAVPPPDEMSPEECVTGADGGAQVTCDPSVTEDGQVCELEDVHVWKIRNLDGSITIWTLCDYGECGVEKPQG